MNNKPKTLQRRRQVEAFIGQPDRRDRKSRSLVKFNEDCFRAPKPIPSDDDNAIRNE
jgi:hypothetical protein